MSEVRDRSAWSAGEPEAIGAMLIDPNALRLAVEALSPDSFRDPRNREVFRICRKHFHAGDNLDFLVVAETLRMAGLLKPCGGHDRLIRIAALVHAGAPAVAAVYELQARRPAPLRGEGGSGLRELVREEMRGLEALHRRLPPPPSSGAIDIFELAAELGWEPAEVASTIWSWVRVGSVLTDAGSDWATGELELLLGTDLPGSGVPE